ncbi:MAG: ribonuclease P protein component [Buchnera aphidicola (Kaburagia rhusicola rhusicola)]
MKLLTTLHFQYVFNHAHKVKCKELIILKRNNTLTFPRLGMILSKKNIKYSFKRNQIKRIIRESFRLNQYKLINSDFIVIANSSSAMTDCKLLAQKLENLWVCYYQ